MLISEVKKSNLLLYYIESKGQEAIPWKTDMRILPR